MKKGNQGNHRAYSQREDCGSERAATVLLATEQSVERGTQLILEAMKLLRGGYIDAAYDKLEEVLLEFEKLDESSG